MKVEIGDSPVLGRRTRSSRSSRFPTSSAVLLASGCDADPHRGRIQRVVRLVCGSDMLPFHRHALNAALAAREAKAQGKFWAMQKSSLKGWPAGAGVGRFRAPCERDRPGYGRFKAALDSRSGKSGVDEDAALAATRSGAQAGRRRFSSTAPLLYRGAALSGV